MEKTENKTNAFFGGVPTEPDVKLLREAFPAETLLPGVVIAYSDVENVIGIKRTKHRFKTVTTSWRKSVETEHNIILGAVLNTGFKALNDSEKVGLGRSKLKGAARKVLRSRVVFSRTKTSNLTDDEITVRDFLDLKAGKAISLMQIKTRAQLPEI